MPTLSGRQIPKALHYVFWFNTQSNNYEPVAVFNTKDEAEKYKIDFDDWLRERNPKTTLHATVMQMSWTEFVAVVKNTKIEAPILTISLPEKWTPAQISRFQVYMESILENGIPELPEGAL